MTQMTDYQRYIAMSRYARYLPEEKRRETWEETVGRYCNFFHGRFGDVFPKDVVYNAIVNMENMPSMRALMTAGKALDRDEVSGYNCAYMAVDNPKVFDEAMYILMCGTGLGFSVERQAIAKLPEIAEEFHETNTIIQVHDSKIGWASAYRELISLLYSGQIPKWDLSKLRIAGAPLKTFGGRSSGPEPLDALFKQTIAIFKKAAGRKLTSIECHSVMSSVAGAIVVGGVRRSALISLSNLSDDRMRNAKSGQWWIDHPEFALANNSVAYTEKPDIGAFMKEWISLYESKSGERGIFNRRGALKKMEKIGRRDYKKAEEMLLGVNPCSEIFLRSCGLCNLTTSVAREHDSLDDLKRKVEVSSILGTFQSTLTTFRYLRNVWKKNAEDERLLGVSFVGIMDHPVLNGSQGFDKMEKWCNELRAHAIATNKEWAAKIGIEQSVAVTCTKPEGTVSQLVDAASGIHARYSKHYIRTVRNDKLDPLGIFLKNAGVPCEDDAMKPDKTWVFSFPQKAPSHAKLASDMSALDQLNHYLVWYRAWAEHTISITVYVREHEWLDVGAWVYEHFDDVGGVSFLPYSEHSYQQAPYQPIEEADYISAVETFPSIDWATFDVNEHEDKTTGAQQYSCSSGVCELI
jgi:ribonucleoside-diphosphate reductase alpha chain